MTAHAVQASQYVCFMPSRDSAVGAAATRLNEVLSEAFEPRTSFSLGNLAGAHADAKVYEAVHAAADDDRNLVGQATLDSAIGFLRALPREVASPVIVVESDGQVGFDWEVSPRQVLSVHVGGNGMLGYAALFNHEPIYGKVPFVGALPATIRYLLQRLSEEAA